LQAEKRAGRLRPLTHAGNDVTEPTAKDDRADTAPVEHDRPSRLPWQKPTLQRLSLSGTDGTHTVLADAPEGLS
jgi:hypothetical protein